MAAIEFTAVATPLANSPHRSSLPALAFEKVVQRDGKLHHFDFLAPCGICSHCLAKNFCPNLPDPDTRPVFDIQNLPPLFHPHLLSLSDTRAYLLHRLCAPFNALLPLFATGGTDILIQGGSPTALLLWSCFPRATLLVPSRAPYKYLWKKGPIVGQDQIPEFASGHPFRHLVLFHDDPNLADSLPPPLTLHYYCPHPKIAALWRIKPRGRHLVPFSPETSMRETPIPFPPFLKSETRPFSPTLPADNGSRILFFRGSLNE